MEAVVSGNYRLSLATIGGISSLTIAWVGTDSLLRSPAVINLKDLSPATIIEAANHLLSRDHI